MFWIINLREELNRMREEQAILESNMKIIKDQLRIAKLNDKLSEFCLSVDEWVHFYRIVDEFRIHYTWTLDELEKRFEAYKQWISDALDSLDLEDCCDCDSCGINKYTTWEYDAYNYIAWMTATEVQAKKNSKKNSKKK